MRAARAAPRRRLEALADHAGGHTGGSAGKGKPVLVRIGQREDRVGHDKGRVAGQLAQAAEREAVGEGQRQRTTGVDAGADRVGRGAGKGVGADTVGAAQEARRVDVSAEGGVIECYACRAALTERASRVVGSLTYPQNGTTKKRLAGASRVGIDRLTSLLSSKHPCESSYVSTPASSLRPQVGRANVTLARARDIGSGLMSALLARFVPAVHFSRLG